MINRILSTFTILLLAACSTDDLVRSGSTPDVIAEGFDIPDGIAVIADGEYLFADRTGSLYHLVNGEVRALEGIPSSRMSGVYGGLLDVSLHPDFRQNHQVYISFNDLSYDLSVARFELRDGLVRNLEVIFRSDEFSIGSRIEWEDASHFFLSFGIGGDPYPDPGPQSLDHDVGKIHRLRADGSVPADNPVFAGSSGPTTVYSYGHRNPQGLFYDPVELRLYATEHGPLGGDEMNVVEAGGNYGWPLFSHGLNYDNTVVSDMTEEEAAGSTVLPLVFWGPDHRVAPSGLLRDGGAFLLGALYSQDLLRYDADSDETTVVARRIGRVRDVARLPDGDVLLSLDAGSPDRADPGRVIRIPLDGAGP